MSTDVTESASEQYIPLLPLRDVVVYPFMVIPLFVGREKSISALESAMSNDKQILLLAQRSASDDEPVANELYEVGTVATILQLLKEQVGTVKALVEGGYRASVKDIDASKGFFSATIKDEGDITLSDRESEVLARSLMAQFEQYVKLSKKVPAEILASVSSIDEPSRLVDTIPGLRLSTSL